MQVVGRHRRFVRVPVVAALVMLAPVFAGCSGSDGNGSATTVTSGASGDTAANGTEAHDSTVGSASTLDPAATTSSDLTATTTPAIEGAGLGQRSAPADGKGTSLLGAVRVGVHDGYERITFEFTGSTRPAYRIQWADGPITADGSGEPVEVAGGAYLEMIMQPASGFDMETGLATYTAPDRIPMVKDGEVLADLVRTGDFEAVLTWVAGAREQVPFAVRTFTGPTRLVIDLVAPETAVVTPSEG